MSSTGLQKAYDYIKIKINILRKRDPKNFLISLNEANS